MWAINTMDILAVIAFSLAGAWRAREKGLDPFGVVMLAVICAFGGGWMRDILLARGIPATLQSPLYLPLSVAVAIGSLFIFTPKIGALEQAVNVVDAFGLGLYSASAALLAMDASLPLFSVCLVAVVTGAGGGILRDLIVNDIPLVFRREIYALCSVIGAMGMYAMGHGNMPPTAILTAGFVATTGIRLLALWRNWHLPARPMA